MMDRDYRVVRACDMVDSLCEDGARKREVLVKVSQIWNVTIQSINDELLLRFIYTPDKEK